jgi:S-adenosylmethionine synthetase
VDRSATYAARWVAKNIVAAELAERCEVQLSYAIGVARPLSVRIDTFGTGTCPEELLCEAVQKVFDLRPERIIEALGLKAPIYTPTSYHGHFGRDEFPWEATNRTQQLRTAVGSQASV